jgi:hypothetical protein
MVRSLSIHFFTIIKEILRDEKMLREVYNREFTVVVVVKAADEK